LLRFNKFVKKTQLNFEYYIANKISSGKSDDYARPVVRISYISIALGLALMIISVAVVIGFKHSISSKIIGFASHLQIVPFDNNDSFEQHPLDVSGDYIQNLKNNPAIAHYQFSAHKAGVLKTNDQIQSVVLKGVGADYDQTFFNEILVEGKFPAVDSSEKTDGVLISKLMADKLNLKTGDDVRVWFVSSLDAAARGRKFFISGIFNTSIEEFDNVFLVGDIRHVQKLNGWENGEVGSVDIMVADQDKLDETAEALYSEIPFDMNIVNVRQEYPQIFNWLDLLDMNVVVILVLMTLVAAITMISTLLILIIERTNMVGILKALGATNSAIRKIFLYKASYIILRGMFWGNLIGIGFYLIQLNFRVFKLAPESYYVDYVPVELSLAYFLLLNAATLLVCTAMLIIPSYYITRIVPAKALRYE